ncbi:efflux RND transporter periplasmic adaptor subunit [Marinifilum sp. D714]|uniref:efflux RND transporter periplasmic adaptor subunit n=1 Tax=Marinifilum sp. D714 TaxID=2937523 RepID=UPI0027C06C03|nr:efflux RND transporter periplasmic adaptor subunit [Marinifilum sp. D714]MDQ2179931.1 efflux RND transporter periplasmic adaptor subunit [Marinifilum sp. D714]
MKRLSLLLLGATLFASCDDKKADLNKDIAIQVSVKEIAPKSIEKYISTTGTVEPIKTVELKSEVAGKYQLQTNPRTGRKFQLGDYVKEGTVVIQLEDKEYENNIKIKSLELRLEISKQTFEKQQSLYKKGGVTLSELKNAEIELINAKYSYEDAIFRLEKLKVKAPFSGTITNLNYYTENTRIEAASPVLSMMDYSKLHMEINLAEKNISMIKTGQPVNIVNYTIPGDTLNGVLAQLSPAIDAETRSFKAVININNSKLLLRPGMFAKGEIVVAKADSALVIPKNVILNKQKGNVVFVVHKGLAEERVIEFGLENPNEVQIVSGLEKKDRLVVKGFETLRNRSKIKIVK